MSQQQCHPTACEGSDLQAQQDESRVRFTPINPVISNVPSQSLNSTVCETANMTMMDIDAGDDGQDVGVPHEEIIKRAESLRQRQLGTNELRTIKERHYLRGPRKGATKSISPRKDVGEQSPCARGPRNEAIKVFNNSEPPAALKSKRGATGQKILSQYPRPSAPLPPDWTLVELCRQYPNHLMGSNLVPFLQHGWTASTILEVVKDANPDDEIPLTNNLIAARLRKTRLDLGSSLVKVLNSECDHEDGYDDEP